MAGINLTESFQEFKQFKNIDRATMMNVLEDVFRSMIRRKYNTDENCDVILNPDNGDLEIWRTRKVMADGFTEDDDLEIELSEARKIDKDLDVGDDAIERISLESFGRRAILAARQTLVSRIIELEKDSIYQKYKNREGELFVGEVYQVWKKELMVKDEDSIELMLPRTEQIHSDFFKKGDPIKAVIHHVELLNNNPKVILSRTAPALVERLLEIEVPEITEGLVRIKKIVREPGERAKVAVESTNEKIDPVGACVGIKGSRVHSIVRELKNENIDVIQYSDNLPLFVTRALSPAVITEVKLSEKGGERTASVFMPADQVSLAIGKNGYNIKLAGRLTDCHIDVYRDHSEEDEEDVELIEFSDEIESWVINELHSIGCDTAKSVLKLSAAELVKRTDLEEETVQEVLNILKKEFE